MPSLLKKIPSIMMLSMSFMLGITMSPSISMVSAMETPESSDDTLSSKTQDTLKAYGHELLAQVLSDKGLDLETSNIFENLSTLLGDELPGALYSEASKYAPSNFFRWGLSSGDAIYIKKRKNQISALVAISWAIADLADQQNEHFARGSFMLVDPNHRLYSFFMDYVKLTTGYETPQDVPFAQTACNFAYRRDPNKKGSSHYRRCCPDSQFGIDVRFEPWEGVYKLLPFDYTHLLFAKLHIGPQQEHLMFLKFEDIGLGSVGAMAAHAGSFLASKAPVESQARREKDIHPDILIAFEEFKKATKLTGNFTTVHSMVFAACNVLNRQKTDPLDSNESYKSMNPSIFDTDTYDIYDLVNSDLHSKQGQSTLHDKSLAFLNKVNDIYPNKLNHLRVGNEVIIDLR